MYASTRQELVTAWMGVASGKLWNALKEVLECRALAEQRVDGWRAVRHCWRLQQERQQRREQRVEPVELRAGLSFGRQRRVEAPLDALHELEEDDEVEHDADGEQRVLARVVQHQCVAPAHRDRTRVLIHRALRVAHRRHVLDYNLRSIRS